MWKKIHRRNARRMYRGFVRLRGVYIKLGQILSIMGTFLPREIVEELEALQDDVPPQQYWRIKKTFVESFGKSPEQVFKTFNHDPIAAASLGQVHEASNEAGDRLAVLDPPIWRVATIIKVDLKVLGWAIRVYKNFVPVQQIERVHEQLADMLARETDLLNEAAMIERMAKNFATDTDVVFPVVYPEWSSRTVMTMSFMDGVKISKKDALGTLGLDPYDVATKLVKRVLQAAVHRPVLSRRSAPRKFLRVQKGPEGRVRIVVLDLGSATELRANLADGMFEWVNEIAFVAPGRDRELLERTTRKYFAEKLLNLNITDFSALDPQNAQQLADPDMKREELRELMKIDRASLTGGRGRAPPGSCSGLAPARAQAQRHPGRLPACDGFWRWSATRSGSPRANPRPSRPSLRRTSLLATKRCSTNGRSRPAPCDRAARGANSRAA